MAKLLINGHDAKSMRTKARLNQQEFWARVGVTQSGGSRYEAGRPMPKPVKILLVLAYQPWKKADKMLLTLRPGGA